MDTLPDGAAKLVEQREHAVGAIVDGRYKLIAHIGSGAMGEVYKAENLAIHMTVAVKLLKPELLVTPEFRSRFQREAQVVASIEHPNVARFLDLVVGDPTFLVMEYVPGETLAHILQREQRLDSARAVSIAIRLCWGLDAAHEGGVVHRDLKPANIMLAPDREHGESPKIVDFGLAKLAEDTLTSNLTRTGQIIGTPAYMSPEQIQGANVDARADVYSLGCVLYEMISGHGPFHGTDDVRILYRQLHDTPQPLSSQVEGVPEALDEVLARALKKEPADRFESMQEMAAALTRSIEKRRRRAPSTEPEPEPEPEPARPVKRRAWLAPALAACIGLAVGALAFGGRGGASGPDTAAAPAGELLMILTEPPGATAYVDGKRLPEPTPTYHRGVTEGAHELRLQLANAPDVVRTIHIAAGTPQAVQISLPVGERELIVKSHPPGAQVLLNRELVAMATPATLSVTRDDFHELRVEKLGYEPAVRSLTPDDVDDELVVTLEAEREPRGQLLVTSPDRLEVWVDGRYSGFETPTVPLIVEEGPHTVELRNTEGQTTGATAIEMKRGDTLRLTINPGDKIDASRR